MQPLKTCGYLLYDEIGVGQLGLQPAGHGGEVVLAHQFSLQTSVAVRWCRVGWLCYSGKPTYTHLPTYTSTLLPIYLSTYQSTNLPNYLHTRQPTDQQTKTPATEVHWSSC